MIHQFNGNETANLVADFKQICLAERNLTIETFSTHMILKKITSLKKDPRNHIPILAYLLIIDLLTF